MDKVNYTTRWKIQLDSNDKKLQVVALAEILDFISNLSEDHESYFVLIINSDIIHFFGKILSYQDEIATKVINKIVCNFSETEEFFKNDFSLILKGYLRVINSIPTTIGPKSSECYHQDIFKCVSILIKRAREREISLEEQVTCIALNVFSLNKAHLDNCLALDLVNLTVELMEIFPAGKETEAIIRNQKLHEVLRSLSTKSENLAQQHFMILISKVLHNALNLIPSTVEMVTGEFKLIQAAITDKFLAILDFILQENSDTVNYEVFLNLFYYFLTSSNLKQKHKMIILNRLFSLGGHYFLLKAAKANEHGKTEEIVQLKSRVVIAEVLQTFLKFISKSSDSDTTFSTKSYEIMVNSNSQEPIDGELRLESMMMFIFMRFIDFTWKNSRLDKTDVLSNVSLILAVTRERKDVLEPAFNKMLTTLYTSTYVKLSIRENSLLKLSSKALLETTNASQIDLIYLRWWFKVLKPKKDVLKGVMVKFLGKVEPGQFDNIQPSDAELFDLKLMMDMFLNNSTKIKLHKSLSQVLCIFASIKSTEYKKLLENFKVLRLASCKRKHRAERLMNVMDVMNAAAESLVGMNVKQETADILSKTLHQPSSTPHVKLAAVQIATNLLSVRD